MNIFVNATAADLGGLKSIVDQFLTHISDVEDTNSYYVFVSNNQFDHFQNERVKIIKTNSKKWTKRLVWDAYGIKKWSQRNNIEPNQIISLQNTPVNFPSVDQLIYLHTPIPFVNYQWSILQKTQRKLWFYKNVYPFFIKLFSNNKTRFIVQSNWLKISVAERLSIDEKNILVVKPDFNLIREEDNINSEKIFWKEEEKVRLFYPAIDYIYKNHKTILKALKILKSENPESFEKVKFIFTVDKHSDIYEYAKELGIDNAIEFLGKVPFSEIVNQYIKSKFVLFPSYIETAGLPLLEAAHFQKLILCADEKYSRELIGDYEGVRFIPAMDENAWKEEIFYYINKDSHNFSYDIKKDHNSWERFMLFVKKGNIKIES